MLHSEISPNQIDQLPVAANRPPEGRAQPSLAPIYIAYKPKVPPLTFELRLDGLNPLQRRALDALPRLAGVPAIRPISKDDGLGFVFQFRVSPDELVKEQVPQLLERWGERFEVAKARAGLVPKPQPAPQPLRPRSPRRQAKVDSFEEADALIERVKTDMSVVDAAIAAHDASVFAKVLGSGPAGDQTLDAVSGEVAGRDELVPTPFLPPSLGASEGCGDGGELAATADEQGHGAEAGAEPVGVQPAGETARRPGRSRKATKGSTVGAPAPALPVLASAGQPGGAGGDLGTLECFLSDLPALRLASPGAPEPDLLCWADPQGRRWASLCTLQLAVGEGAQVVCRVETVPPEYWPQLGAEVAPRVQAVLAWHDAGQRQLADAVAGAFKAARIPVTRRREHLGGALLELPQRLDALDDVLVDMQLAVDLARRGAKDMHRLAAWMQPVFEVLGRRDNWYGDYQEALARGPRDAMAVLKDWSMPLEMVRQTNQLDLFADQGLWRLERQLAHLIDHARRWLQPVSARGDCVRVMAVWIKTAGL